MNRAFLVVTIAAVVLPFAARAQDKPDFSGTWVVDPAKSDPPPQGRGGRGGGGAATLMIHQTRNELRLMSEGRQGPQTQTYKLDGSLSTNPVGGRNATPAKSTAKWDGSDLVIETTRDFQGSAFTTKEVRRLEKGGTEMQVLITAQTPQGEQIRKTVYMKGNEPADPCKVNPNLPICGH